MGSVALVDSVAPLDSVTPVDSDSVTLPIVTLVDSVVPVRLVPLMGSVTSEDSVAFRLIGSVTPVGLMVV